MRPFASWRWTGLFAAGLVSAASVAVADDPPMTCNEMPGINLLANPGADDGPFPSTSLPEGWAHAAWRTEGLSFTWDDAVFREGRKSVRISAAAANDAWWVHTAPVEPFTSYRLSGWIRTEGVSSTGAGAGANLSLYGTWTRTPGLSGTQGWTYVSLSFETGPEVEVRVAARLGYWGGTSAGVAWFDDLRLETAGENTLANGSFERGLYVENGPAPAWAPVVPRPRRTALAWDDAVSVDGGRSLRINLRVPGKASWSQRVVVRPHARYRLSGYIKVAGVRVRGRRPRVGAQLAVLEEGVASSALIAGTADFERVELTFDSGDHEVVTVEARLGSGKKGKATGTAWFDALELVPLDPLPSPRWEVLALVYPETDFFFTDGDGPHHLVATMSEAERHRAARSLRRFFGADVPALTSGVMIPRVTICVPDAPLDGLHRFGSGFWPAPGSTASERSPDYDAVMVIWDPSGVDQVTGQRISVTSYGGLTPPRGVGQTYATASIDVLSDRQRNVLKHEWGHSILFYHEAAGTAPWPPVNNHYAVDYVHCGSGEPYTVVDETDDAPIPWSSYNNELGFTRDYYSGTIALATDPDRCLGITPEAWALGGPVTQ